MPLLKGFENLRMQLDSIKSATNTFANENQIGGGGFGPVFKGELSSKEKTMITVAVKRLNREFGQGDPEFFKEIIMLSAYKHENIISLLGYCDEEEEKILVYEYASKQSLDRHLRSKELTWVKRLQICIGSARGLAYLHDPAGGHQRLLHRDIKSSNILLDENWNAKIADFGLSKMGPANQQISFYITHNISVVGTLGYTDPQYMESGILTKESDVYSFGVVLFEVLCGRLCITDANDRSKSLTNMVRRYHRRNRLNEMVWSHTKDEIHPSSLKCFSTIAYQCLNGEYDTRPIMKKIVRELETSLEYQSVADSKSSLVKEFEHLRIGLDIIKLATNNFGEDHFIAEGGSAGKVYRGEFKHSNKGQVICTVKRLDCTKDDMDLLFWREIMLLSSYKHKNVLSLKGFCDESEERIIVYDFAIHQRLDFLLLDPKFTWIQRLKACLEAACGLEYLHDDKVTQKSVVHGHIRSANILLDQNWNAYITNFGLSRYGHANEEHKHLFSDDKNATLGYFDPIYKNTVQLTKETDVYSFGVVLFEALCSRPCVDNSCNDESRSLPVLIRKNYQEQKIDSVVDDNLRRQIDQNCFDTFVELAYQCLESDKSRRPTTSLVMKTLKTALEYQEVFEAKTNRLLDFEEICPPGGSDLVILYTTSVKGIRKTSKDCSRVHSLLKSLKVLYQERDIAMYSDFRDELQNLGKLSALPRLFIKGRYIGGADDIFLLHEQGKFQPLVRDILNKSEGPCKRCAGVRSVVCRKCNGSNILKTVEGGRTRCTECNKNGLIKCPICF